MLITGRGGGAMAQAQPFSSKRRAPPDAEKKKVKRKEEQRMCLVLYSECSSLWLTLACALEKATEDNK
jgi:hypothetical protein